MRHSTEAHSHQHSSSGKEYFYSVITYIFMSSLALLIFILPTTAAACGSITGPTNWFDENLPTSVTVLTDCSNPFGASLDPTPFQLEVAGEIVTPGVVLSIPATGTAEFSISDVATIFGGRHAFYRRAGSDYVFVPVLPREMTDTDFIDLVPDFFTDAAEAALHVAYFEGDGSVTSDPLWDYDRHQQFRTFAIRQFAPATVSLMPGAYTLVSKEEQIFLWQAPSIKDKFFSWLLPTAHALNLSQDPIFTLDFTLEAAEAEPPVSVGASNILFVPGIMGTRLYEESSACEEGGGQVRERWFSRSECNQLRLKTNFMGVSLNQLYTKADREAIVDTVLTFNIYKSFLRAVGDWKADGLINDYDVLPYDWRLGLDRLMTMYLDQNTNQLITSFGQPLETGYIYELISQLASSSDNGRVTIVGHSNGGLLMKYFLTQLEARNDPLLEKIDNLILVAVPQVGTPEAVIGLLHGTNLSFVMDQVVARKLTNTMPFAHHLLPGEYYFSADQGSVRTPVITFEAGSITTPLAEQFGSNINSWSSLQAFMVKESGRDVPSESDFLTPQVVDRFLLDYAKTTSIITNSWQPPASLKVYQIAGTGIATPSGLTYFTDKACARRSFFRCVEYEDKLGYRINLVMDGDDTVVTPSALAMSESAQVERWWLDLNSYNFANFDRIHRDIFEVPEISHFVKSVMIRDEAQFDFFHLKDAPPNLNGGALVFQLHSPLDIFVKLSDGTIVGSSSSQYGNVAYRRFGEVQYIVIPDEEKDSIIELSGKSEGSFTLNIEKYQSGSVSKRQTFSAIPSTLGTQININVPDPVSVIDSTVVLKVDYDRDGIVDIRYNESGEIEDEVYTYSDVRQLIQSWPLSSSRARLPLRWLEVAERLSQQAVNRPQLKQVERIALKALMTTLKKYENKRWVSSVQVESAKVMIDYLIK